MSNGTVPHGAAPAIERRLATILMADVAGYSRMMGEDEERTVKTLQGHREVFDALLKAHRGRIFNTAGDAILAEFPSAVEAVRCATEIQTALRTRNDHLPPDQRMAFRIGINLGDVIVQGGDLLGDGVNIAARIQTIAEPGGICISGSVYDQIQNKLTLQIRQLGEQSFKNIAQPVRTFSISAESTSSPVDRGRARKGAPAAAVAAVIAVGAVGFWLYRDYSNHAEESKRAMALQAKAEQDKAARATAEREAKLLAALQAAKDALTQAEATKRKAEQDRLAAEAQQREAKMQSEFRSAKEAQQKAAESEKKARAERAAAEAAMKSADAAKKAEADTRSAAVAAKAEDASAGKGIDGLDGAYMGRMCTDNPDGSPRCWGVVLNVKHQALSATWMTRFNNQRAHAIGEIAADGTVKLALDGYTPKGLVVTANVTGTLVNNKLTFSGIWTNGAPITGTWVLNP